ncbi:MAG TPA: TerB family tellurite resistance protein [Halioglobus sp.]
MIQVLKAIFERPRKSGEASELHDIRLAAAALLVEAARADFIQDAAEIARLTQLLNTSLHLGQDEIHQLILAAQERVEVATSLYEFTRVINDHCSATHKRLLISAMWAVAYADGNVDKYEEHLIRQVAQLLFVTHSDYIQCKLAAQG